MNFFSKKICLAFASCILFFACATPEDAVDNVDLSIKKRSSDLKACFDKWVPQKRSIEEAKLLVHFHVENDGSVTHESIKESDLQSPVVEKCVLRVIKSIRFQENKIENGMEIVYPFSVSASGQVPTIRSDQIL